MNFRRMLSITRKEFLHILRDARNLSIALALPALLLSLYGYAITLDVDRVPLIVWDQSETAASRDLVSRFSGSRYFSVVEHARNYRDVERAIDTRLALMALVIPVTYAQDLDGGRVARVQTLIDGSDSNTATIALAYAEIIALDHSFRLAVEQSKRMRGEGILLPLDLRGRVWFNSDLESRNYLIPGLIAVIMMVIAALLTSLTVAGEWERGTMEQLISTPVKTEEMVLGKLIPYFVIGLVDVAIAVAMGEFLFHVPLRGHPALIFLTASVFLVGAMTLGILISITSRHQMLASQTAIIVTFLPSFLLSGFIFAIYNMPHVIQIITYLIPARYFITALKAIYLKGVGLEVIYVEIGFLAIFACVVLALANKKFKKKLE